MCAVCDSRQIGRRELLRVGGAGLLAIGLGGRAAAASPDCVATGLTPDQALEKLKQGNERFVSDPKLCVDDLAGQRDHTKSCQAPWASVVSCSDSRLPPELVFGGLGLGEVFVARNAGNLVDTATLGTMEYGAAKLGSPLIVVLAHSSCGAVQAACDVVTNRTKYDWAIGPMIDPILPSAIAVQSKPGDFVENTARESARRTAGRLTAASSLLTDRVKAGTLRIVTAIYDLPTGMVTYFD